MMKSSWEIVSVGLDQLWFTPFFDGESPEDRAQAIENFLKSNGWTWNLVLKQIESEIKF